MMRRSLVVGVVILTIALVFMGLLALTAPPTRIPGDEDPSREQELIRFEDAESSFWPYVNKEPRFRNYSPINVVVLGADGEQVIQVMRDSGWNRTELNETDATSDAYTVPSGNLSPTNVDWGEATGATRYAYVHDGSNGTWVRETAQLHDGTYFGHRFHIRMYESPVPGEWVAMQVHTEHFDWFSLRHAVDGMVAAQLYVENDLMGQPFVDRVWRMHMNNAGPADSDGWGTVIELALLVPLGLVGSSTVQRFLEDHVTPEDRARLAAARDRVTRTHLLMAGAIIGLVLGVRLAGIQLEHSGFGLGSHTIAGMLFPVLAVGLPLVTYAFAHSTKRRMDAALAATLGLGVAFVLDYSFLSIDVLPIPIVLHRIGVMFALGLIAAGAARRAVRERRLNGLALTGVALWLVMLALPLLGFL